MYYTDGEDLNALCSINWSYLKMCCTLQKHELYITTVYKTFTEYE